jgi:peroxiredoxin
MKTIKKIGVLLLLLVSTYSNAQKAASSFTVYVFLSENCSLSQNYIEKLNSLYSKYKSETIVFSGVFSNYFSTKKTIESFKGKYAIQFPVTKDKEGRLREHFGATVTPEVFVTDKNAMVIYSGRIDDSFYDIGKKRNEVTTNDLEDILKRISTGAHISGITKTQAVGSVISLKK